MESPLRAILVGMVAGFGGGLLGIGGGVIYVPGMVLLMGLDQRRAHATSVAVIIVSATTAVVSFHLAGHVDWSATPYILLGAAFGAPLGSKLLGRLSHEALVNSFIVILVVASIKMAIG